MLIRQLAVYISLIFGLTACSSDSTREDNYLIRVNDFYITADEVSEQLKFEAELDSNFYISQDTKTEFAKDLIQSQLLIQEAKKQRFDEREHFRQTIQRYWESTLIRDLLVEKSKQFRESTVVSEKEILDYFESNKEFLGDVDFLEVQAKIAQIIEDRKVTEKLGEWIEQLKANAQIEVTDPELKAKITGPELDAKVAITSNEN